MGEAFQEGDCLGKGMAWLQSLLGKKGGQPCCLLISSPLEPGNLGSSGDFARDSPLDLVFLSVTRGVWG